MDITIKAVIITLIIYSLVLLMASAIIITRWYRKSNAAPTQSYFEPRKLYYIQPGYASKHLVCEAYDGEKCTKPTKVANVWYSADDILEAYGIDRDLCIIQGSKDYLKYTGDVSKLEHITAQDAYNLECSGE